MLAALAGNAPLIKELLARGADRGIDRRLRDDRLAGCIAAGGRRSGVCRQVCFPECMNSLAPSSLSLNVDQRLIKIDSRQGEFLIFHLFLVKLRSRINQSFAEGVGLTAPLLALAVESLPAGVLPEYRKKRTYLSSLLPRTKSPVPVPTAKSSSSVKGLEATF